MTGAFASATILEIVAIENIAPFIACRSPDNPIVMAEGTAPCAPIVVDPWEPPSALLSSTGLPLATIMSQCECVWGGVISVAAPAELSVATDA